LDRLGAEHAALLERGEVAAARGLYKFWGDVSHDDPAALTAWADQAARPGRESAQALWVLANVEDLTPDAWPAFRRLLGEARPLPPTTPTAGTRRSTGCCASPRRPRSGCRRPCCG